MDVSPAVRHPMRRRSNAAELRMMLRPDPRSLARLSPIFFAVSFAACSNPPASRDVDGSVDPDVDAGMNPDAVMVRV